MAKQIVYLFIIVLALNNIVFAQDSTKLKVGDKAPHIVLPTSENSIQSFSFPYNNKYILLFFWSSSVAASQENLFKYSRIFNKYSSLEYKTGDGFDAFSIAIQSDKNTWTSDIKKYNLSSLNNCIALKGYKDFYIKAYHLTQTPSSFLIDEFGKILFVNPDIRTIIGFLEDRKNATLNNESPDKISGKIVYGSENLNILANQKVIIANEKGDSIQSFKTNEKGLFYFGNLIAQNFIIKISKNDSIKDEDKVYLASENGDILSALKKSDNGFECNLQDIEMVFLKPTKETISQYKQGNSVLKDLSFTENLFKQGGIVLNTDTKSKLDALAGKLKLTDKAKVQIITHTDSRGDDKANMLLSAKRSEVISNYLVSKGIAKARIKTIGMGETELLNKCANGVNCSLQEHEMNQRTEIKCYEE